MEQKEKLLTKYRFLKTNIAKTNLKNIANSIKSMKRKLKKEHYRAKIEENKTDSKKLWELLKEVTRNQTDKKNVEPEEISKTKANQFNRFFATIGKKTLEKLNIREPSFTPTSNQGYTFLPMTPSETELLIEKMKINTAVGYDKMPAKILRH